MTRLNEHMQHLDFKTLAQTHTYLPMQRRGKSTPLRHTNYLYWRHHHGLSSIGKAGHLLPQVVMLPPPFPLRPPCPSSTRRGDNSAHTITVYHVDRHTKTARLFPGLERRRESGRRTRGEDGRRRERRKARRGGRSVGLLS